ncbi:hypothetical protein ACFLTP_10835 [Chloroflexota bacterium]
MKKLLAQKFVMTLSLCTPGSILAARPNGQGDSYLSGICICKNRATRITMGCRE